MRLLCVGECMAELAPADRPGQFRLGFAGDTFNTAWYHRALRPDARTSFLSCAGTDAMSDQMLDMMSAAGIDTAHVARLPNRTVGLYLIALRDGERSFSYWREHSAARLLARDRAALEQAMDEAELIYFSGITLAILDDHGRATLLEALARARKAGRLIAFDSNLRPRLWTSVAQMTSSVMDAAAISDIVLPSFDDEAVHFGDAHGEATVERYARCGARTVVVKNGADPIHFLHEGERGTVCPAPAERVVDTTAAGDSFNAGFLAALDDGRPIGQMTLAASRIARRVIAGKGALVPLDPEAIEAWRQTIPTR